MNDEKPPRVAPRITSAPRIRQVYWCDLPEDAQLPEFRKTRPVVVMSRKSTLHGKVTVLPLTSKSQPDNPHAYPIQSLLRPGRQTWVICDHPMTLAVSRLSRPLRTVPRISEADFEVIKERALRNLPY